MGIKAASLNLYKSLSGLDERERVLIHRSSLSKRTLPNLFIIGTQKGGTSSLYEYLVSHPAILRSYQKEAQFFNRSFRLGLKYYRGFFPKRSEYLNIEKKMGKAYAIDASPDYLDYPGVAEKLAQYCPNSKFIVLLREPADRAFSHYKMTERLTGGFEKLSFKEALSSESDRLEHILSDTETSDYERALKHSLYAYFEKGLYAKHLKEWFKHFKPEQFLILFSEDFFSKTQESLSQCFDFLELEDWPIEQAHKVHNKGMHKGIDEDLSDLRLKYSMPNLELSELLGCNLPW